MSNNNKTPAIRFKGFTDTWEQRELGDEAIEILAGGDIDKSKTVENGKYPIYANALTNDGVVGYYDDYYRVKAPAVTVTGRGEVGFAQARMVDFTPVVRLLAIRSNHDCCFLENAINNHKVVVESTGVPQLTVPQLSSYNIFFPKNIEEETRIGEYFRNLDRLITLHQRKYDKLIQFKAAMLQKMFPQNGADKPEIRFKGFTDAWEQRKLGEALSFLKDGTHGTHPNSDDGVYLLSAKNIKNGEIIIDETSDRKISKEEFNVIHSTFKLQKNDVLLTIVGSIGEVAILKNPDIMTFQRSVAFLRPKEDLISSFLKTEIESDIFQKELSDRKSQSAQPGVYLGELGKIPFAVPIIEEQQQIGSYFRNLDNLITLHQRKCDKYKSIKSGLLKKLFP